MELHTMNVWKDWVLEPGEILLTVSVKYLRWKLCHKSAPTLAQINRLVNRVHESFLSKKLNRCFPLQKKTLFQKIQNIIFLYLQFASIPRKFIIHYSSILCFRETIIFNTQTVYLNQTKEKKAISHSIFFCCFFKKPKPLFVYKIQKEGFWNQVKQGKNARRLRGFKNLFKFSLAFGWPNSKQVINTHEWNNIRVISLTYFTFIGMLFFPDSVFWYKYEKICDSLFPNSSS